MKTSTALLVACLFFAPYLDFSIPVAASDEITTSWLLGSWDGTERSRGDVRTKIEFFQKGDAVHWKWNRKGVNFEADCEGDVTKLGPSELEMDGKYVYHTNLRARGGSVKVWLSRAGEDGLNGRAIGVDNSPWPISVTKTRK